MPARSLPLKLDLPLFGGIIVLILELIFLNLGIAPFSFPIFLLGFFLIVYLPGRLVIHWLKLAVTPLERLTLELGTGYVLTTLLYFIFRALHLEFIYFLLIGILAIRYFYGLTQRESPWPLVELKGDLFSFFFILVILLILLNVGFLNFSTLLVDQEGYLSLSGIYDWDSIFHVSLAHELANSFPPHYPYAGNFSLAYHFFPDLFAAIFVRFCGLAPSDLIVRYLPLFHFVLLFLGAFVLIRSISGERWLSLFTVFLINFLGNHGFVFFLNNWSYRYWEYAFVPQVMILNINPLLIATALILIGYFCLTHYLKNGGKAAFFLAAFFLGLVAFYKVFVVLMVLLGLLIPALILGWRKKDMRLFYFSLATALVSISSVLVLWFISPYGGNFIEFNPWFLVFFSLAKAPLPALYGYLRPIMESADGISRFSQYKQYYQLMFSSGAVNFLLYFFWYGLVFLLGSLGLRVIGLKEWLKDLFSVTEKPVLAVIAYTILMGFVVSLLFTIPPEDYNVVALMALSLYLMSYYTAKAVVELLLNRSMTFKLIVVALFIVLAVPTTLNLIAAKQNGRVSPPLVRLGNYLKKQLPPGSIVAYPLWSNPYYVLLPALGGIRSMAEQVFLIENLIGQVSADKLRNDNMRIYQTTVSQELASIVMTHNLAYVIEDEKHKVRAPKDGVLTEIYSQDGYVINRVILGRNK